MTANAGTVFAYGVTSSGKTHTMHVSTIFFPVILMNCNDLEWYLQAHIAFKMAVK